MSTSRATFSHEHWPSCTLRSSRRSQQQLCDLGRRFYESRCCSVGAGVRHCSSGAQGSRTHVTVRQRTVSAQPPPHQHGFNLDSGWVCQRRCSTKHCGWCFAVHSSPVQEGNNHVFATSRAIPPQCPPCVPTPHRWLRKILDLPAPMGRLGIHTLHRRLASWDLGGCFW